MNIRRFKEQDWMPVIELWRTVFRDDPPHNDPEKVIEAKLAVDDLIFVAEHEGEIVGACMAGYDGHRGWLYSVAVHPEKRRNGVGTILIQHALDSLRNIGCLKVNLQVRATNTEVTAFYESLGFKIEDRLSMGVLFE